MSENPIIVHDQILEASFLESLIPMKFDLEERNWGTIALNGTTKERRKRETKTKRSREKING